jgi:hypothetical protein
LWSDEEFVSMLENGTNEYESGKIKPISRKQLEAGVKKANKLKFPQDK